MIDPVDVAGGRCQQVASVAMVAVVAEPDGVSMELTMVSRTGCVITGMMVDVHAAHVCRSRSVTVGIRTGAGCRPGCHMSGRTVTSVGRTYGNVA